MRSFQDMTGRTWMIAVTVDAIKRVRDLLHEDLLDIEQVLPRLLTDPILLCDVVYCICKPQADVEGVSDVEFARSMAGDAIARAKNALVEDLIDFFPEPSQREALRLAIERHRELSRQIVSLVKTRLGRMELPQEIEAALSAVGDSSTS